MGYIKKKVCDTLSIISVCHVRVIIDNLINGKSINGPISMVMALVFYGGRLVSRHTVNVWSFFFWGMPVINWAC